MRLLDTNNSDMIKLIMRLRDIGVSNNQLLKAIETIERTSFIDKKYHDIAYKDNEIPIDCGQTLGPLFTLALIAQNLEVNNRHKILEVGTGSGYQAAIISKLARRIYTIERYRTLAKKAEKLHYHLQLHNISVMVGNGIKGWQAQAPYDRILISAATNKIPKSLFDQLKDGGIMIIPIYDEIKDKAKGQSRDDKKDDGKAKIGDKANSETHHNQFQSLYKLTKKGEAYDKLTRITSCNFPPILKGTSRNM